MVVSQMQCRGQGRPGTGAESNSHDLQAHTIQPRGGADALRTHDCRREIGSDDGATGPVLQSTLIRILDPDTNNMEMLTYLDQMTAARERTR